MKVADLGAQPGGGQRVDPPQAHQPPGGLRPRGLRERSGDLGLELFTADHQRAHRPAIVLKRPMRARLREPNPGQPTQVRLGPVGLRAVKTDLVATEEPVNLSFVGTAKIGGQELAREAVPAEDRMQAFLWRQLVPARR